MAEINTTIGTGEVPANSSTKGQKQPPDIDRKSIFEQQFWIECEAILGVLTISALYVFICIVRYVVAKRHAKTRDSSGKQGKGLYIMLVFASGFTLLRMASDHVVAFTSSISDEFCFATIATSTVMYALSLVSVYIFLWMRQSIFYANPVLAKILNKAVTAVSWSTLVVMILSAICLTVLYNIPGINGWDYQVTEDGCKGILIGDTEIVAGVSVAATIYFQITLLALFLYPLLSRKTQKYRSAGKQTSGRDVSHGTASSISNTDDNLTDGDNSKSRSSSRDKKKKYRSEYPPLSENESGVDVQTPSSSGKYSESPPSGKKNPAESGIKPINPSKGGADMEPSTDKTKLKDQKRPSIFSTSRFFKSGSIFYRRNPKRKNAATNSPIAKRYREKKTSSASQNIESETNVDPGDRKASIGSQKKDRKKRQKRSRRTQQGRRMMSYLRKSLYMTLICVATDIACTVVQAQVNVPEIVYLVIFDLNLMINVICIVMSFREWDVILFPLCARTSKRTNGNAATIANGSARPDPAAAKRRAEVLRSVMKSTTPNSPKEHSSFSYDPLPQEKKADALCTPENVSIKKELDLNGKT